MGRWIHDRADHIRAKNPDMSKSESFAIATQQSYAAGKAPKKYGTRTGRQEAKMKYDSPKTQYKKTADPSHKSKTASRLAFWKGLSDEFEKIAIEAGLSKVIQSAGTKSPLTARPKLVSKPHMEPAPPAPVQDHLSSSREIHPPPVTMAGST